MNEIDKAITEIKKAIAEIERQYKIGVDYGNCKDHTAICLLDEQAELALAALYEKQEREKGCELCNSVPDSIYRRDWTIAVKDEDKVVDINYCPMCGRRLEGNEG